MVAMPTSSHGTTSAGRCAGSASACRDDRLLYPAVRKGPKGQGTFSRVTWDEALDHIAERMVKIRDTIGAEAILLLLRRIERPASRRTPTMPCSSGRSARRVSRARSAPRQLAPPIWALAEDAGCDVCRTASHAAHRALGVNPAASGFTWCRMSVKHASSAQSSS